MQNNKNGNSNPVGDSASAGGLLDKFRIYYSVQTISPVFLVGGWVVVIRCDGWRIQLLED